MDELSKIVRVLKKLDASAPHEVMLIVDATTGQNAVSQIEVFKQVAGVTSLAVTKLDSTARARRDRRGDREVPGSRALYRHRRRPGRSAVFRSALVARALVGLEP